MTCMLDSKTCSRWAPLLKTLGIALGIILLSSFLAPILFKFLPYKFERIFNRLIMIFTLLSIFLFVRFKKSLFETWGVTWNRYSSGDIFKGFISGLGVLALLTAVKMVGGAAAFKPIEISALELLGQGLLALAAAFLIGFIEEFFFRGVVFSSLEKRLPGGVLPALLITSFFYAMVHFVSEKKIFIGPGPDFFDGLRLTTAPFLSLREWPSFWREAAGLFVFGIVLNDLFIRTRALYAGIGLHAGCVFFVKMDGFLINFSNDRPFLLGSAEMVDSITAWSLMAVLGIAMRVFVNRPDDFKGDRG